MIRYKRWLVKHYLGSPSALGGLADFANPDKGFPGGAAKKETIANYLQKSTLPERTVNEWQLLIWTVSLMVMIGTAAHADAAEKFEMITMMSMGMAALAHAESAVNPATIHGK